MLPALFILFLLFQPLLKAEQPALHFCTVASHSTRGLKQLLDSCNRNGITIDILGFGLPFRGLAEKLIHVQAYLEALPGSDIVLFVDGYDVLILDTEKNIREKFRRMSAPFVISVERYCWPFPHRSEEFPKGPTSFRYINSGSYIGYVDTLKKIFEEMAPIHPNDDDQGLFTLHYFKSPQQYKFDVQCDLFLPLAGVILEELVVDTKRGKVRCLETGSTPSIIHGNGGSRPLYQQIYEQLFQEKQR